MKGDSPTRTNGRTPEAPCVLTDVDSHVSKFSASLATKENYEGLSEKKYEKKLNKLRAELMKAQLALQQATSPVVIIIAGVVGAGKGEAIALLNEWLDARNLSTHSFWNLPNEALRRPHFWRYWTALPRRGKIAIWFNGWYEAPLLNNLRERHPAPELNQQLKDICRQETTLVQDGAVILKFWFHLSKSEQEERLHSLYRRPQMHWRAMNDDWKRHSLYERFQSIATSVLNQTHGDNRPWLIVPSADRQARNLILASQLGKMLNRAAQSSNDVRLPEKNPSASPYRPTTKRALDNVDLSQALSSKEYESQLIQAQSRLHHLFWSAYKKKISTVLVFEGWDAAGKGGAIRRLTAAIDPRLFRILQIGPPAIEEHAYHYLWRFWRDLPRDGQITIFDRSWYGRVLVERIEDFATRSEWQRAYEEINEFEREITRNGTVLLKFWIHISKEKQLARFQNREQTPHKKHKITKEDWRNRDRWTKYEQAVNDMVAYTHSPTAPWKLIAGNDKRFARVQTLLTISERLESAV